MAESPQPPISPSHVGGCGGTYVSKPQHVEAVQWTGDNDDVVVGAVPDKVRIDRASRDLWLYAGKDGAQEWVPVPVGHWLVHPPGDLSDVWPVDSDYFENKYEPVLDA